MASVPTIRRRRLGAALRRLRDATGMSLETVAEELGWSTSKISRIEQAKIAVTPADVRALLGALGAVSDEVETLVSLAGENRQPGWWRQYAEVLPPWFEGYLSLESEATRLLVYESEVVLGLLQTEDYAAEILRHSPYTPLPDEAARAAELRRARQVRLTGPDPLRLDVVINEGALRRVVGGPDVMRAQLHRLVEASELPNVVLRVLPFESGAHPGVDGSFTVLEFPDPGDPRIVYLEHMTDNDYLDKLRDIAAYRYAHERLRAAALPPDDSREMISGLIEELTR
ncbi:MAG TPA: helix-turn-helix transcriptional regulator [Pseudonocardiaceae bacterium]|jgi:transcriptional regulator with XRE-family HTH domain|nr:helix-turn-helix transcriptional regulator [Pseudonocardiaceae bacterium]